MRLSEKTIELSLVSQISYRLAWSRAIWFGLTQKQERELGFDAATQLGGQLVFLQFKASSVVVRYRRFAEPRRRFTLPHAQLERLQELAQAFPECVYYVFPDVGTTEELAEDWDLVERSYLLEVASLPSPMPAPDNQAGIHYAYMAPPELELRSDPYIAQVSGTLMLKRHVGGVTVGAARIVSWLRERQFSFKGMRAYGLLLPAG